MGNQWEGTGPGGPSGGGRVLVTVFAVVLALGALFGYRGEIPGLGRAGPDVAVAPLRPVPRPPLDPRGLTRDISPVLVNVTAATRPFGAAAAGSGIVLTRDGQVLTSHHVVKGAKTVQVSRVSDGAVYTAEVLGYDARADIALLDLSGADGLATARIGRSADLRVRDEVLAIGNAGGSGTATAVTGRISDLDSTIMAFNEQDLSRQPLTGMLEIEAPVSSGQSGGALTDHTGAVVGVIAAASGERDPPPGDTVDPPNGYAVPIDSAMRVVRQIRSGTPTETVHIGPTATLGVLISDAGPRGARIDMAIPGLPAEEAGLVSGEIIISIDDRAVTGARALRMAIDTRRPAEVVRLGVLGVDGGERVVSVRLVAGTPG
ncbi:S1C family serine protease [Nocardia carnea]|uniref:S1C family serine protease n=1 Tax=Nocardia carnea TaxID=37328 RepID=UPI002455899C|nr:trypsin-like peptidase domain-containing protein [Nocardia carnea]